MIYRFGVIFLKCSKCGSEWRTNSEYKLLDKCPFCGAVLSDEAKNENIQEVMKNIVRMYGKNIIADNRRFLSLVSDFAPNLQQERNILASVYKIDAVKVLISADHQNIDGKRIALNAFKKKLIDEAWLSEVASERISEWFTIALEWELQTLCEPNAEANKDDIIDKGENRTFVKEYPDGVYIGAMKNNLRHGLGRFAWNDGSAYEGEFANDEICGKGKYIYATGVVVEGDFTENDCTGVGKITYLNGDVYEGEVVKGKREGRGRLITVDNKVFEGRWQNNKFISRAIKKHENKTERSRESNQDKEKIKDDATKSYKKKEEKIAYGNGIYVGELKGGIPDGNGRYETANGNVFEGMWRNGDLNGTAKWIGNDGSAYEGEWKDNFWNGLGKFKDASGSIYEGYFVNGKKTGKGKVSFANGDIYDGNFGDDKKNGLGRYLWVDGDMYEGEWRDDEFSGTGKFTDSSGNVYEGEFRNGKKHGFGKLINTNGSVYEGVWKNDTYIGKRKKWRLKGLFE